MAERKEARMTQQLLIPKAARSATERGGPAVEIEHSHKTYGNLAAVDGLSLRLADAGTIRLLGLDPQRDRDQVHRTTGCSTEMSSSWKS
jgi:hypothetical protein